MILLLIKPILPQESEKFACNIPTDDTCLQCLWVKVKGTFLQRWHGYRVVFFITIRTIMSNYFILLLVL